MDEIQRASSDKIRFWELKAPKVLEAATNSRMSGAAAKAANSRRLLTDTVHTDADINRATEAIEDFVAHYPQYIPSEGNRVTLGLYMLEKALDCRDAKDLAKAFVACALAGTLTVQVGD